MRKKPEAAKRVSTDRRKPTAQETLWLARALSGSAAYVFLYWAAVATGAIAIEGAGPAREWALSMVVADGFFVAASLLAGYHLARGRERQDVFTGLAGGAAVYFSLVRIAHGLAAGFDGRLSPGERLEICAAAVCLCVGVWAVSLALRMRT